MQITNKSGRKVHLNSATEDVRINAGIAADSDNPELDEKFFQSARPAAEVLGVQVFEQLVELRKQRGRPRGSVAEKTKVKVNLRVDPDVLEALRDTGAGWQTRVNDLLRREFLHSR